jgi:hypothetical protein
MKSNLEEVVLRFVPEALERCYEVARVLDEDFDRPMTEYALLGLARASDPLRVIATPLLPRQRVTPASIEQRGSGVLEMRREIEATSAQLGERLVPIAFVHRHPGCCMASHTDLTFLNGPFLSQLSTVTRFDGLMPGDLRCSACRAALPSLPAQLEDTGAELRPGNRFGLAFSLIVNAKREHRIYAAARVECPTCGRGRVCPLDARLATVSGAPWSETESMLLHSQLRQEILRRLEFSFESVPWRAIN